MKKKRHFCYSIEYLVYRLLSTLVSFLPRRVSLIIGANLGRLCGVLFAKRRKLAEKNMALAMPKLSPEQVEIEISVMYEHLGILAMDVLNLKRFHDEPELSRYFDFENLKNLNDAYGLGKGVLILTGHLGNWEAGSCFLPKLGFPTAFIAKRMKNPRMDNFIKAIREQGGAEMIDAKRGARKILKALGKGKVVCVLMDQHNREGIAADFFDRPARTTTMMVKVAMKTGAPVIPAFTFRTEENRYTTSFGKPMVFAESANHEVVKECTQKCNDIIESAVRSKPSQWFWLHNRWKQQTTSCSASIA
ncbi:MAG: hypothetical protein C0615_00160 [Desulfuromonas sp.]|nr:MAG: hypothetical protein C0615_00160 [Desulfuromonas sp.]